MEKSFGLFFHLKKENTNQEGEQTVYMRITINGLYCEINTKRKCSPDKWNVSMGRLSGKSDFVKTLMVILMHYNIQFLKQKEN
ncbi:MAG: Arm DNA-binding domain-containing protein [Chitinophagaceae bacterium]